MSAYRIFIFDNRVSTAVCLEDGSYLQVHPVRKVFPTQDIWVRETFWANREGGPRSYTLGLPDGSKVTYLAGRYTLFQDGKCVSSGFNVGAVYVQRYPYVAAGTRTDLISERAKLFGVSTDLRVKSKAPVITAAPEPKERVSRWAKMSQQEREAWPIRMREARAQARKRRDDYDEFAVLRALGEQSIAERDSPVVFETCLDYMRRQGLAEEGHYEDSYYGEEDFAQMDPAMAMVFRALGGPIRKSHERCDCGEC